MVDGYWHTNGREEELVQTVTEAPGEGVANYQPIVVAIAQAPQTASLTSPPIGEVTTACVMMTLVVGCGRLPLTAHFSCAGRSNNRLTNCQRHSLSIEVFILPT